MIEGIGVNLMCSALYEMFRIAVSSVSDQTIPQNQGQTLQQIRELLVDEATQQNLWRIGKTWSKIKTTRDKLFVANEVLEGNPSDFARNYWQIKLYSRASKIQNIMNNISVDPIVRLTALMMDLFINAFIHLMLQEPDKTGENRRKFITHLKVTRDSILAAEDGIPTDEHKLFRNYDSITEVSEIVKAVRAFYSHPDNGVYYFDEITPEHLIRIIRDKREDVLKDALEALEKKGKAFVVVNSGASLKRLKDIKPPEKLEDIAKRIKDQKAKKASKNITENESEKICVDVSEMSSVDADYTYPLQEAVYANSSAMFNLLLEHKAKISTQTFERPTSPTKLMHREATTTVLISAIISGNQDIVLKVLTQAKKQKDIKIPDLILEKDPSGHTSLTAASALNLPNILQLLVNELETCHEFKMDEKTLQQICKEPVFIACGLAKFESVLFWCSVLRRHSINDQCFQNYCLIVSCWLAHVQAFKFLIGKRHVLQINPWFDYQSDHWWISNNAMFAACSSHWTHYAWFQIISEQLTLLQSSANCYGPGKFWQLRAVPRNSDEIVTLLTSNQIEDIKLKHDMAIHEIVRDLLEQHDGKAHIDDVSSICHSPLSDAFQYGNVKLAEYLMVNGASLLGNQKKLEQNPFFTMLFGHRPKEIQKNTLLHDVNSLIAMCREKYGSNVDYYIRMALNRSYDGSTVISQFYHFMEPNILQTFIKNGANVAGLHINRRNILNGYPLYYERNLRNLTENVETIFCSLVSFYDELGTSQTITDKLLEIFVNFPSKQGWTPLHVAFTENLIPLADFLLKHCASVTAETDNGFKPFMLAARDCHEYAIKHAKAGKQTNSCCTSSRRNALHVACMSEKQPSAELIEALINHDVCINQQNEHGRTPMRLAAMYNPHLVQKLFNTGSSPDVIDKFEKNMFHYAAQYDKTDQYTSFLLAKMDLDFMQKKDHIGHTPLLTACCHDNAFFVQLMKKQTPAKIAAETDNDGKNALHICAWKDSPNCMRALKQILSEREFAEMMNHKHKWDKTPIIVAIEESSLQTVALFFENMCADFGLLLQQENYARNILHLAACNPHQDVFEFVVSKAAKNLAKETFKCMINDESYDGNTPLHLACEKLHLIAVTFLLQHGADPNIYNKEKRTPIFNAVEKDEHKVVEALIKSGAHVASIDKWNKNPLFYAKSKSVAEMLIETAAKEVSNGDKLRVEYINAKGFVYKRTPIMYAVKYGRLDLVKFLHVNGARLDELDKHDDSILHFVPLLNDQVEMAKYLLENGSRPFLTQRNKMHKFEDREYLTPLLEAVKACRIKLTKYFIKEGSDVRVKDLHGQTILHLAAETCDKSMIDAIKDSVSQEDFIYLLNSRDSNCRLPSEVDSQTGDYLKILLRKYENARKSLNLEIKSFEDRDFFNEYLISTLEDIVFRGPDTAVTDKLLELLQKEWPQPNFNRFFHMNLLHYCANGKDLKIHEIGSRYGIKLEKPVGSDTTATTDGIGCVVFCTIQCDIMEIFPDIKTELLAEIFKQSYNAHFTDELMKEPIEETISNGFRWRFGGEWVCISADKSCDLHVATSRVGDFKNRYDVEIDERKYLVWMICGYIYE